MPVSGSTVTRRQLGRWLRGLRDAAGKTDSDVEEANVASPAKLWRIETGRVSIKVGDVRALCWLYGTDAKTTNAFADLAAATTGHGWWEDNEIQPTRNGLYLGLEAIAGSVLAYDAERVPALLQTPDYIRALAAIDDPSADRSVLQERVKLGVERQCVLTTRVPPLRLTAVLGEGALARRVAGPAVMAEQFHRLQELAQQQPHIDIRVLTWRAGAHPAMRGGAFNILDFASDDDPAVVHVEGHTGARYFERRSELDEYRRVFARVYRQAVPISEYKRA